MTRDDLLSACAQLQDEVERQIDHHDIPSVEEKMVKLGTLMGLCANMHRWARKYTLQKQGLVVAAHKDSGMPASIMKMQIEAALAEELAVEKLVDRLGSALTHNVDALRTVISLHKQEMAANLMSGGGT